MICVSIGRGRHRHVVLEHQHLVERGAQLVELRLDYIRNKVNLQRLIENRPCPVIIAIRREEDGGRFKQDEDARRVMLRSAIVAGVEYVDLEDDVADKIPRYGKTKRIISHHDFRKTPADLQALHDRLAKLDPDIIKIATMANHASDNMRMLELVKNAKIPTVGMCMGDIGTPSRILCGKFGAPFTYATFHHERALAPGQLSFDEMQTIYRYDSINAETEVYGVVGDPIGHSLGPLIHNAAFREQGLNKVYVPFRVPKEDLADFLNDAPKLGIRGLSVTIPHKESVLEYLSEVDEGAGGVGAANTIIRKEDGFVGSNTDYAAAMACLRRAAKEHFKDDGNLAGKVALVLGSGGVARAIAFGLKAAGAEVVITGRNTAAAEHLAESVGCGVFEWAERHELDADILVNCTPVGMHPKLDETPYEKQSLASKMIVFDTVYNPANTLLLKDAKATGCRPVGGVEMFLRQAALQYKLFAGQDAPTDVMKEALSRATSAVKF